jgi:hypothetical protein
MAETRRKNEDRCSRGSRSSVKREAVGRFEITECFNLIEDFKREN